MPIHVCEDETTYIGEIEDSDIHFVEVREIWSHIVRVPADSEEEAIEKVKNGAGEWGHFHCEHRLNEEMKVIRTIPKEML